MPFAVSVGENFELLEPSNAGNPLLIQAPDGRNAIVGLNKDRWYPTVMDANNQTTYLNGTDIQYTIQGTEKLVNSGIILPPTPPAAGEPQTGPPFPPVNSFTATFAQAGTYPYFCAIHPWMSGQVIVREGGVVEVGNRQQEHRHPQYRLFQLSCKDSCNSNHNNSPKCQHRDNYQTVLNRPLQRKRMKENNKKK